MKKVDVLVIGAGDNWKVDNISSLFQLQYYSYYDVLRVLNIFKYGLITILLNLLPDLFNYFISIDRLKCI